MKNVKIIAAISLGLIVAMPLGYAEAPRWDRAKYAAPSEASLKSSLSPLAYNVMRNEGTEPPFKNEYWDNHNAGIYVDRISGEPLFLSADKFDSGTGWPSFTRPIAPEHVAEKTDSTLGFERTEVRSAASDSHLGHVFSDGPQPTGKRYCMNSASLRFIPLKKMEQEGYGEFIKRLSTNENKSSH